MPSKRLTEEGVRKLKPTPGKQVSYFDTGLGAQPNAGTLTLTVSYGGTKTWAILHYVNGKPKYTKLGRYPTIDLNAAREQARGFLGDPAAAIAKREVGTFKEIAEDFIKRHVDKEGLRSKPEIERLLRHYIYPRWESRKFLGLKRSDVVRLLDEVEDQNGSRQAEMCLAYIRKIMNWYATRSDDYLPPLVKGMGRVSATAAARKRILDDDELRAVWQAAGNAGTFGAIVKTLLLTAQRRQKVTEMEWDDIVDGEWRIRAEAREKSTAGSLLLPQIVLDIISKQPRIAGNPHVFASATIGGVAFNSFSECKTALDAASGVTGWTLHDLRRTARSLMARVGVSSEHAERVLGHAIQGVESVYDRHDYRQHKGEALRKLAAQVDAIINPPPAQTGNVISLPVRDQVEAVA